MINSLFYECNFWLFPGLYSRLHYSKAEIIGKKCSLMCILNLHHVLHHLANRPKIERSKKNGSSTRLKGWCFEWRMIVTFKVVQLVDHFIAQERSKQILCVLRFIKLRICSVGSGSVALNRNVCQFHLAGYLELEICSRVDGYFPCDISQP